LQEEHTVIANKNITVVKIYNKTSAFVFKLLFLKLVSPNNIKFSATSYNYCKRLFYT